MTKLHKKSASKRRKVLEQRRLRRAERFTNAFMRSLEKRAWSNPEDPIRKLDRNKLLEAVVSSLRSGEKNAIERYLDDQGAN